MLTLLIVICIVLLLFGGIGWGGPRYGAAGYASPVVLILVLLFVLWALGLLPALR